LLEISKVIRKDFRKQHIFRPVTKRLSNHILLTINTTQNILLRKKEKCKSSMVKFKLVKELKLSRKLVAKRVCLLDLLSGLKLQEVEAEGFERNALDDEEAFEAE
jgi:hypothetical protein